MNADRKTFKLVHHSARQLAMKAIAAAPEGWACEIRPPAKSRDQEAKYHAMFSDIARQVEFMGEKRDLETWKRLLVDAFVRVKAADGDPVKGAGTIIPNLDGTGFVQLGVQTRRFTTRHASEFIEYLHAWGAQRDVRFREPLRGYEQ